MDVAAGAAVQCGVTQCTRDKQDSDVVVSLAFAGSNAAKPLIFNESALLARPVLMRRR